MDGNKENVRAEGKGKKKKGDEEGVDRSESEQGGGDARGDPRVR